MASIGTFRGRLATIVAGGLLLRLAYVLVFARHVPMAGDSQFFHAEPRLLAAGHGYIEPFVFAAYHISVATAAHPPLYPFVLTVPALAGIDGILAQRVITCLIGAVVLAAIGLLGRRVGGDRVGLTSAGIAAIYPVLVSADGALMSESLYGLMVVAALYAALTHRGRRDLISAIALGVATGLAALTRSEALLLLPLLVWPLTVRGPRAPARVLCATLACLVVLTPWTIRNWEAFHQVVVISHNDSTVIAGANCHDTYYGVDLGSWSFACISQRVTLHEGVQADRWRSQGLHYLKAHLSRLPVVLLVRLLRTWDFWQPRRQTQFAESRARWADEAGVAAYYVLLPLAVAGAVLLRRRRSPAFWILLAPVALVTLSTLLGWGLPRFRHAAEPSTVVLAAFAVTAAIHRRRPAATANMQTTVAK
jgi:4-amino-4-deoxy-L-arabinose transferase-like glycosyltransferase